MSNSKLSIEREWYCVFSISSNAEKKEALPREAMTQIKDAIQHDTWNRS